MFKKIVRAFVDKNIDGKMVIGNPASVFILEKNEDLNTEDMSILAKKENQPITSFIKHVKYNEFNIRYFFPSGQETNFCGHGTITASKVIKDFFDIRDNIIFYINKKLFLENIDNEVVVNIKENDFFELKINRYFPITINNSDLILNIISNFENLYIKDIDKVFRCNELNDYIVKLNNNYSINNITVNNSLLSANGFRAITITSKSNLKIADYFARVFTKELNNYEDIVCGSSSCYLSTIWNKELNKKNLISLFPYNNPNKYYGGVEYIEINNNNKITLAGFVK